MNIIKTKPIVLVALVFLFLIASTRFARSENVSERLQPAEKKTTAWRVETGYFIPKEGDIQGAPIWGLGFEYTDKKDTLFADFLYSQTDLNITIPTMEKANNTILQAGLLKNFEKSKRAKIGLGIQFHRMALNTSTSKTGATVLALVEYDMSCRWTLRLQSSQAVERDSIRFGSYAMMINYNLQ